MRPALQTSCSSKFHCKKFGQTQMGLVLIYAPGGHVSAASSRHGAQSRHTKEAARLGMRIHGGLGSNADVARVAEIPNGLGLPQIRVDVWILQHRNRRAACSGRITAVVEVPV